MRPALILTLFCCLSFSCKKTIEKLKEDYILDVMVDGQWRVTQYNDNGIDRLATFSPYRFQYYRNMTVYAIKGGAVEYTGDWNGDVATKTVWADFGNAADPVAYLNGTWTITNNTLTYVVLVQGTRQMRIDKD